MFYGIEQSTDLRCKNTVIKTFSSKSAALKWKNRSRGGYTYPAAADENLPGTQQNFHHTFRSVYEVHGLIRPTKKDIKRELDCYRGSSYVYTKEDLIANAIWAQTKGMQIE